MNTKMWSLGGILTVAALSLAWVAPTPTGADLWAEFQRRDTLKLTAEQGAAMNFLVAMKVDVTQIENLEVIDQLGRFVSRDRQNVICYGDPSTQMLRCKTVTGLTTVSFQGDSD